MKHFYFLLSILLGSAFMGCNSIEDFPTMEPLRHTLYIQFESPHKKNLLTEIITDTATSYIDSVGLPLNITTTPTRSQTYCYFNKGEESNTNHSLCVTWESDIRRGFDNYDNTFYNDYLIGLKIPQIFGDTLYHPLIMTYKVKWWDRNVISAKFNDKPVTVRTVSNRSHIVTITVP